MSTHPEPTGTRLLPKILAGYRTIAILLLNLFVVFAGFNFALYIAFSIRDKYGSVARPSDIYPEKSLASIYPGYRRDDWKAMMNENWSRPYVFGGYLIFKEAPYRGKYVNVSEAGFRFV